MNECDESLRQFEAWLKEEKFPEVKVSQQPRSIKTAWKLVRAGEKLLNHHTFDSLSVDEVCQEASMAIGAFYGRFSHKQAFFATIQKFVVLRSEVALRKMIFDSDLDKKSLRDICQLMASSTVSRFRENKGVIRASLQKSQEGGWDQFKQVGDEFRQAIVIRLSSHLLHLSPEERIFRVTFAHQMLVGTLVHTVLNEPRAVRLDDDGIVKELENMLYSYLMIN